MTSDVVTVATHSGCVPIFATEIAIDVVLSVVDVARAVVVFVVAALTVVTAPVRFVGPAVVPVIAPVRFFGPAVVPVIAPVRFVGPAVVPVTAPVRFVGPAVVPVTAPVRFVGPAVVPGIAPVRFVSLADRMTNEIREEAPWTMMFAFDMVICCESKENVEEKLESWIKNSLWREEGWKSIGERQNICV